MATALAGVPHRDPVEACRAMLENFPEAPCVPRLSMSIRMYLDGVPCLIVHSEKRQIFYNLSREEELRQFYERVLSNDLDSFALNPQYAAGFYALLDLLKQSPWPRLKLIHIQFPGLLTWGLSLTDLNHRPAWYDRTMREVLIQTLVMKAQWQEKKIREILPDVEFLVTLGEPTLGMMTSPFGSITGEEVIQVLNEFFQNIRGLPCVHCCSNMDWPQLMKSKTRVINFDAYQFAEKMALYPKEVSAFIEKGGMLAWGVVPVAEEILNSESEDHLKEKLEEGVMRMVGSGIDKQKLWERSFVTPCCSTATLSKEQAEVAFRYTQNISQKMRRKYFPELGTH
jgi:hypothetical protein